MTHRSTSDLIALMLTATVGIVVVLTTIVVLAVQITEPEEDVTDAADAIGKIIAVIVGVIAGFIAGRKSGNGNGS